METLGEKILVLRKSLGLSQEELAEKLGVSRQTIYRWESNSVLPDSENTNKLCEVFAVPKSYFFGEIAITNTNSDGYKRNNKKQKILLGAIIINSLILAILMFINVLIGTSVFTPNSGNIIERNNNLQVIYFIILLVILCVDFIIEVSIIIVYIKLKKK